MSRIFTHSRRWVMAASTSSSIGARMERGLEQRTNDKGTSKVKKMVAEKETRQEKESSRVSVRHVPWKVRDREDEDGDDVEVVNALDQVVCTVPYHYGDGDFSSATRDEAVEEAQVIVDTVNGASPPSFDFASEVESQEDADSMVRLPSNDFEKALRRAHAAGRSERTVNGASPPSFDFASEVESQEDADSVVRLPSKDFEKALRRAYEAGRSERTAE